MEGFLEKTVQMFSYLTDKDLFAEIYRCVRACMHLVTYHTRWDEDVMLLSYVDRQSITSIASSSSHYYLSTSHSISIYSTSRSQTSHITSHRITSHHITSHNTLFNTHTPHYVAFLETSWRNGCWTRGLRVTRWRDWWSASWS